MIRKICLSSLTTVAILLNSHLVCAHESATQVKVQQNAADTTAKDDSKVAPISHADLLKVSEAFGHFIGKSLKMPGVNFDLDQIIKGMREGYAGKPSPMNEKEYEAMMAKVQEQAYRQQSTENLKAANAFLEKNAKEKGVVVIEPGKLEYSILKEGTGEVVKEHDSPQIQYVGKFIDGTSFGNSQDAGGPITIPLDQTIPGFSKGIVGMKEGEKRKLFVHPDLGYGTSGHLPPNSLLIFEVEVLKANNADANKSDKDDSDDDEADADELSDDDYDDDEESYEADADDEDESDDEDEEKSA